MSNRRIRKGRLVTAAWLPLPHHHIISPGVGGTQGLWPESHVHSQLYPLASSICHPKKGRVKGNGTKSWAWAHTDSI